MKQRFRSWFVAAAALLLTPFMASAAEKVAITITPKAVEKVYDGTPLMASECEVTFKKGETWVNPGDHAVAEYADEITDVYYKGDEVSTIASRIKSGSAKILNAQGADVSSSYAITLGESTLKVTPRAITVTTPSYTNEYNGVAQSSNEVFVKTTGGAKWYFPENDGAIVTNFASLVKAGTTNNWVKFVFADPVKAAGNYIITENFGELVIKKFSGYPQADFVSGEVIYNGSTNQLGIVTNVVEKGQIDLQNKDWLQYSCDWTTNKNCGTYAAFDSTKSPLAFRLSAKIYNEDGEDVSDCYANAAVLNLDPGSTLTIKKRSVTLTSGDATKPYDGTPLVNTNVTVTADGFVAGEGATYNVMGSQKEIGWCPNSFTYTLDANTSAGNYSVSTEYGILTVTGRNSNLTITAPTVTKVYDGLALSNGVCTVTTNGVCGLAEGDYLASYVATNALTDVGISSNDVAYVIKNAQGADVTKNYTVNVIQGKLEITKRPITVQFFDTTYEYDGEEHYPTNAVITGSLATNEVFVVTQWDKIPVDAGVYACTNCGWAVSNVTTKMFVSANYDVTKANEGALVTITKRPATVTTGSDEKFYDGEPLTNEVVTITGLADADTNDVSAVATGTRTEVGRADNTVKIFWGNAKETNYSVTTNMGVLTVKAQRLAYDLGGGDFTNSDQVAWSFVPVESQPSSEITNEYKAAKWLHKEADKTGSHVGPYFYGVTNLVNGGPAQNFDKMFYNHFTNNLFSALQVIVFADPSVAVTPDYVKDNKCGCCVKTNQYVDAYLTLTNRAQAVEFAAYVDQRWAAAEKAFDEATKGAKVRFYTPVRAGYAFVGWKNELTGVTYPGDGSEQMLPKSLAESEIALFKAVWEKTAVDPEMTEFFDATDYIVEAKGSHDIKMRDATYRNVAFTRVIVGDRPDNEHYCTDVKIAFPNSINTYELVTNVMFSVDGGVAFKPWGTAKDVSWDNAVTKPVHDDDLQRWTVTWSVFITKGMLAEALASTNEVGQALATRKLYVRWTTGAGEKFQAVYTANFDADSVTLSYRTPQSEKTLEFPCEQTIAWDKGYDTTKSEVNSNEWAAATAITSCDIREDAITVDDLTRTGYVFKGWSPATTRGYVAQMKDVVLENMEVLVTALWETNTYTAVFTNELKYADDFNIIYKDPTVTNVWTVEDLELDLPGKGGVSAKYYWFDNWTNAAGKVFSSKKIQLCDIGTDTVAGTNTLTFWASMSEKNFKIRYDLTNGFEQINKAGTPYQAFANNIRRYSVSTNDGEVVALNDASCFGCKFLGWSPSAVIDPMAASNMTFTAKWAEYQAMVVENDTATTNFFDSVAAALATVTNSNTTIAFLDAKGDGLKGACPIEIAANLTNIVINFCALDYTNAASVAALTIGTNADVTVRSHPLSIGWNTNAIARLVQFGGNAVKIGEGSTFTLDDTAITLDVIADKEIKTYEDAKELYFNGNWRIARKIPNEFRGHDINTEGTGIHKFYDALMEEDAKTNIFWASAMAWDVDVKGVTFHKSGDGPNVLTNMLEATNYFVKVTNDYWTAKAAYETATGAAIYAPSNATLVLKAGMIGAKAYGESNKCVSINWVGHREYLGSTNLFFATKPVQESAADGMSQVAAGYIWTMNANKATSNEFAYTVSPIDIPAADLSEIRLTSLKNMNAQGDIGSDGPETAGLLTNLYNRVKNDIANGCISNKWEAAVPEFSQLDWIDCNTALARAAQWTNGTWDVVAPGGTMLGTNATLVGTLFVEEDEFTNGFAYVKNPSAVVVTNAGVVAGYAITARYSNRDLDKAKFWFGGPQYPEDLIPQLVETLETGVATNAVMGYDWDGAAGSSSNMVAYTLNYSGKDIIISNATEQLFPKIATIKYTDNDGFLVKPDQTYTILDTTKEGGLVLEPAIGLETNDVKGVFRFVGWEDDYSHEIVSNIVHTVGAGDDVTNRYLTAKWDKLEWVADSPTGTLAKVYFTPQEAIDDLPNGGTARYTGTKSWKAIAAPLAVNGKAGVKYTIDLGGKSFVSDLQFKGDYLVEITGGDVTLTNGTLSAGLAISGPEVLVGGVHSVGADTKVTLAKGFKVKTYMTMVCADEGSTVTADGAQLNTSYAMSPDAGVKAFAGATLELKNVPIAEFYRNTVFASNATFVVTNSLIDLKADVAAITVIAGSKVELCDSAGIIRNTGAGSVIDAEDSAVEISTRGTVQASGMNPVILLKNSSLELNNYGVIKNTLGLGVYSTANAAGKDDNAALVLNGGTIDANGVAIMVKAGTLTVPANSTFYGSSKDATVYIDNALGLMTAEDIVIEGGTFDVKYAETTTAPVSVKSSNSDDPSTFISNFLGCAYVEGVKGALFKTAIPQDYCAKGYKCCVDGQRIVKPGDSGYEYWYYVDTIAYDIDYDLDGGTRVAGTEVWPTSYDVEDDVILLPSNTVKKTNYVFGGWTISNTVTDVVTTNMVITPGVDFGSLALKAIWNEHACTVYVDYQGADGYPKYYWMYDYAQQTHYWFPSTRYPYDTGATGKDPGVTVSPSKNVTFDAPTYRGYEFVQFEDVNTGRRYEAGEEYTVLDFTFDAEQKVYLRAVWASNMSVYDDDGRVYKTIEDALASTNTVDGMTLSVVGKGTAFQVGKALVIDKNITLDLNGKQLMMSGDFAGDTLVTITNAPEAAVVNGTIDGADAVESIRVIAEEAPVAAIDSTWELKTAVKIADDYLVEGFECVKDGELWIVQFAAYALTFDDGVAEGSVREDLTVTLNNDDTLYTKDSDPIVLNDPERTGYTFAGWVDESGKKVVGVFVPAGKTKSTVLTATWTATSYEIRYELNGGVFVDEAKATYTCEDAAFDLVNPVRPGYAFGGWRVNGADPVDPATLAPLTWTAFGTVNAVAVWKVGCYEITFDTKGGKAVSPLRYTEESRIYVEIPAAEKVGCKFVKWVDQNGDEVATGTPAKCFSAALTAVYERVLWTGDNTVVTGNPSDGRGTVFNGNVSYTGSLVKDGIVMGKVAVTVGKPNTKGVATVTMTVSQELLTGKTYTLKNTAVEVTGDVLKNVELTGGTTRAPIAATIAEISDNGLTGTFEGYEVIASADRFASNVTKIPAATLAYLQGNWTAAFACACEDGAHGAATLKLTVAAKGKVTVTGNLPDGTAVSTTAQLIYGDGVCLCPVVINAYNKKGGMSFMVWFGTTGVGDNLKDDVQVTNVSPIYGKDGDEECKIVAETVSRLADMKVADLAKDLVFKVDLAQLQAGLPEGYIAAANQGNEVELTFNGTKHVVDKASKVSVDATTGEVKFDRTNGDNDLQLSLTLTTSTGAITGSFKVYASYKSGSKYVLKTYTAKVYGVLGANDAKVYGVGTSTQADIGSAVFTVVAADVE